MVDIVLLGVPQYLARRIADGGDGLGFDILVLGFSTNSERNSSATATA